MLLQASATEKENISHYVRESCEPIEVIFLMNIRVVFVTTWTDSHYHTN